MTLKKATPVFFSLLSAAAVFAIPNIPSSSLIILVTILAALGIPVNYVGILFAIDWLMQVYFTKFWFYNFGSFEFTISFVFIGTAAEPRIWPFCIFIVSPLPSTCARGNPGRIEREPTIR